MTLITHVDAWVDVCPFDQLISDRGVCALIADRQVAIFRVDDDVFALSNYDPFSRANVLSRGIVGSRGDRLKVASPMFKQSFDLRTGECLDDDTVSIPAYSARVVDGRVQVIRPVGDQGP
jgi:nitrite reductase (NADH) small subunit